MKNMSSPWYLQFQSNTTEFILVFLPFHICNPCYEYETVRNLSPVILNVENDWINSPRTIISHCHYYLWCSVLCILPGHCCPLPSPHPASSPMQTPSSLLQPEHLPPASRPQAPWPSLQMFTLLRSTRWHSSSMTSWGNALKGSQQGGRGRKEDRKGATRDERQPQCDPLTDGHRAWDEQPHHEREKVFVGQLQPLPCVHFLLL